MKPCPLMQKLPFNGIEQKEYLAISHCKGSGGGKKVVAIWEREDCNDGVGGLTAEDEEGGIRVDIEGEVEESVQVDEGQDEERDMGLFGTINTKRNTGLVVRARGGFLVGIW